MTSFISKIPKARLAFGIAILVILIDQILKIWVKTTFYLGESRQIFPWFDLAFIENNGMAFGMELGPKLALTTFRILFVGFICYFIWKIRNEANIKRGYMICLALVLAGALGNIIDCMFYGLIFNNPAPPQTAEMFVGGYAPFLEGRVVDMLHFPLFTWPEWVPVLGGGVFFSPVFNFADAAISCGIIAILIFYTKQLSTSIDDFKSIVKAERQARKAAKANKPKTN